MLQAPVLACTIDHLIPAVQTQRGGRFILPCLRLMSADLVIDEVDDFTGSDSKIIGQLIHLAGMLGRKVMISSATIPPDMALGYFKAYQAGWQLFASSRGLPKKVGCAWVDEFNTHVTTLHNENALELYESQHTQFTRKRINRLNDLPVKRLPMIVDCSRLNAMAEQPFSEIRQAYFNLIINTLPKLHQQSNQVDPHTGIAISFGVIRLAHITPCVQLTLALLNANLDQDTDLRAMAYHSRQVLLLRHEQETFLDTILKRKEAPGETCAALQNPVIRKHLNTAHAEGKKNIVCIVVATPVEEVGRDHDFDWAVVEPSSFRSIIQMLGRVRRHRTEPVDAPNVAIMQYNLKHIEHKFDDTKSCFLNPGYEQTNKQKEKYEVSYLNASFPPCLSNHDINYALNTEEIKHGIHAGPRIHKSQANHRLAMLEHAVIKHDLLYEKAKSTNPKHLNSYLHCVWYLTGVIQTELRFRASGDTQTLCAYISERYPLHPIEFCILNENGIPSPCEATYHIEHSELTPKQLQRLLLTRNYLTLSQQKSDDTGRSLSKTSLRFGEITLPQHANKKTFLYNEQLGLYEPKD